MMTISGDAYIDATAVAAWMDGAGLGGGSLEQVEPLAGGAHRTSWCRSFGQDDATSCVVVPSTCEQAATGSWAARSPCLAVWHRPLFRTLD